VRGSLGFAAILIILSLNASGLTIHVPGDAPSIQAGLDLADAGDIVEIACGIYEEINIHMKSGVILRSETGMADCVTIDAQGEGHCIRGFNLEASTIIEGITLKNGSDYRGGGADFYGCILTVQNCVILDNQSQAGGGGLYFSESRARIFHVEFRGNNTGSSRGGSALCFNENSQSDVDDCRFVDNGYYGDLVWGTAAWANGSSGRIEHSHFESNRADDGAGIAASESQSLLIEDCSFYRNWGDGRQTLTLTDVIGVVRDCTFFANTGTGGFIATVESSNCHFQNCSFISNDAETGGNIGIDNDSVVSITHCLIANSIRGKAIEQGWQSDPPKITCSNFFGNPGGDWTSTIYELLGVDGNISEDPLLCTTLDYRPFLQPNSPCLPENNDCGLMGTWGSCGTALSMPLSEKKSTLLASASPNPFNPSTRIQFTIEEDADASVFIFDISGRRVTTLQSGPLAMGDHELLWNGKNHRGHTQSSGVYFCRIEAGDLRETLTIILLK
jgi:hypothetical protein